MVGSSLNWCRCEQNVGQKPNKIAALEERAKTLQNELRSSLCPSRFYVLLALFPTFVAVRDYVSRQKQARAAGLFTSCTVFFLDHLLGTAL